MTAKISAFESETAALIAEREPPASRRTLHLMGAAVALALGLSATIKIDRVVTASGQLVSLQPTSVVQSFDNAIVTGLEAREGDRVKAGQVLATLDPTFAAADVDQLKVKIESLNAEIARLEAEHAGRDLTVSELPARYAGIQETLWQQRRAQRDQQIQAYDAQIAAANSTVTKYQADMDQYAQRLGVARQIEGMRQQLYQRQDESKMTLLQATDQRLELQRNLDFQKNAIAESQHQREQLVAQRSGFLKQWQAQVDGDLVQKRTERDTAESQLAKATKHSDLVLVRAPVDAVVLQRAKVSEGSVLREATTLYTLMPVNAPLEVEVNIDAHDIGYVQTGDKVTLKLDALNYLQHGTASGTLMVVSQDSFTTAADGSDRPVAPYYKGHVRLDSKDLKGMPAGFRLMPGMTVAADMTVGHRTLLSYLTSGALRTVDEAMREP
jgi:hemolysin D